MGKNKVVIIGIDSGSFDVILPMIERGELPNIASIMKSGAWGDLQSTVPSVTLPAWASFLSGVNPGKLGIFYLTRDSHSTYDEGPPTDISRVPVKFLWHHLSDNGKKVISVIPFPFPPTKINGIIVSNTGSGVGLKALKSYPSEISNELVSALPLEEVGKSQRNSKQEYGRGSTIREEYLDNVIKHADMTTEITRDISLYLLGKYEWDCFITVFKSTDDIQHRFWSFMDPSHPLYNNRGQDLYGDVIFDTYRKIDRAVGDILSYAKDATVVMLSDHGMAPIRKFFYANRWLNENGLLKIKGERRKADFRIIKISLRDILNKLNIRINIFPNLNIPIVRRKSLPFSEEIDWSRTKAYATTFGININMEGRERHGIVKSDEYNGICETLRDDLYQLTDPQTGERVFEKVYRREEIYTGPCLHDAPDIVYHFKKPFYHAKKDLFSSFVFEEISKKEVVTANHLNHASTGIFLAKGPDIKTNERLDRIHIIDIAPTILYLMGLPIPMNMDGRLLWEVLHKEAETKRPPRYIDSEDLQESMEGLSPEEEDIVKEQLRQLGYI